MLEDLRGLKRSEWIMAAALFLGVLCPGLLVIFVFDRALFLQLDSLKLVLLSLSISLPVFACFFMLTFTLAEEPDFGDAAYRAAAGGFAFFYPLLLASQLVGWSFRAFAALLIFLLGCYALLLIIQRNRAAAARAR